MIKIIIFFLALLIYPAAGQISGNRTYSGDYNRPKAESKPEVLYLSDTSFIIQAKVLMNVKADEYIAVLGVSQSGHYLKDCLGKIDERIGNFIKNLHELGIPQKNIFTDMITQNPVYEYLKSGSDLIENLTGFEIKKNVIIRFNDTDQLDEILLAAADQEIYDIIKVDYNNKDVNNYYNILFEKASEIINSKKGKYIKLTNNEISDKSEVYAEDYQIFYPGNMYRSYKAYESNNAFPSYGTQKIEKRKLTTWYYDPVSYSGYDLVVNPIVIQPVLQYELILKVRFEINN